MPTRTEMIRQLRALETVATPDGIGTLGALTRKVTPLYRNGEERPFTLVPSNDSCFICDVPGTGEVSHQLEVLYALNFEAAWSAYSNIHCYPANSST